MPGGKNTLQVELGITANTQQAKAALSDLAQSLNKLQSNGFAENFTGVEKLKQASLAAQDLQQHLAKALNPQTNVLDLGKFSRSLKEAGQTLDYFKTNLLMGGDEGQKAFYAMSEAIARADVPITTVNKKLAAMGTTLKNTIKWQLSSSIIHGFVGAVEQAYGYAKNLNKSLNDIRIVTGQSADQMAAFAEKANKAARALSTTTNEYAQASLIYYQQGLSDKEVEGRTNTTIKLANVSRQTAEETSQQLTAVWNNFYDGSKSLEYYADVMTALGAATASSTDEISTGLRKFAATANTVGLSYEYATAALATVTATTRESADTVGTAFRTLFSRLEGLKLGETLDDGTDLNKYSAALASVGVNIKDVNGDMRSMDNILDDLGDKWQTLAQDQKVALAETVGGARQYTQLMALLDNWGFFEENLNTANNATGTLQEQADIYAQSWEAARDRVTAALENIYSELVNDKFFIKLSNFATGVIDVLHGVIEGFGGLKGMLLSVSAIFMAHYAKEMPVVLSNIQTSIANLTGKSVTDITDTQSELLTILSQRKLSASATERVEIEGLEILTLMNSKLLTQNKQLSSAEKERYQQQIETVQQLYQYKKAATSVAESYEQQIKAIQGLLVEKNKLKNAELTNQNKALQDASDYISGLSIKRQSASQFPGGISSVQWLENLKTSLSGNDGAIAKVEVLIDKLSNNGEFFFTKEIIAQFQEVKQELDSVIDKNTKIINQNKELKATLESDSTQKTLKSYGALDVVQSKFQNLSNNVHADPSTGIKQYTQEIKECAQSVKDLNIDMSKIEFPKDANISMNEFVTVLDKAAAGTELTQEELTLLIQGLGELKSWHGTELTTTFKGYEDYLKASNIELGDFIALLKGEATTKAQLKDFEGLASKADKISPKGETPMSTKLSYAASAAMQFQGAIQGCINSFKVLQDDGASTGEKLSTVFSTLSTSLFAIQSMIKLFQTAGSTVGLITMAIGVLIAGVIALTSVIQKNSLSAKLERARESTEELKTKLQDATAAAQNLKSTFDSYNEITHTLNSCIKGTQEWTDNLNNAKQASQDLINNYSVISDIMLDPSKYGLNNSDILIDKNGVLQLSEKAQQKINEISQQNVEQISMAASVAKAQELDLEKQLLQQTESKSYQKQKAELITQFGFYNANAMSVSQDRDGNRIKNVDDYIHNLLTKNENELRNYLSAVQLSITGDPINGYRALSSTQQNEIIKTINQIRDIQSDALKAEQQVNAQQDLIYEQQGQILLSNQDNLSPEEIAVIAAGKYYEQVYNANKENSPSGWTEDMKKSLVVKDFLMSQGMSISEYDQQRERWSGTDNVTFIKDGQDYTIKFDEIVAAYLAEQISDDFSDTIQLLQNATTVLNEQGKTGTAKMLQAHGSVEGLTLKEYEAMNQDEAAGLATGFGFEMQKVKLDKDWQAFGHLFDTLKIGTLQDLIPLFSNVDERNILSSLMKTVKPEQQESFAQAIIGTDWTSIESIEAFQRVLSGLGIEINTNNNSWKQFIDNLKLSQGAIPTESLAQLASSLATIKGLLNDLEVGKTIDEKTYSAIVGANAELANLFQLQADGKYVLLHEIDEEVLGLDTLIAKTEYYNKLQTLGENTDSEAYKEITKRNFEDNKSKFINVYGDLLTELGYNVQDISMSNIENYKKVLDNYFAAFQRGDYSAEGASAANAITANTFDDLDKYRNANLVTQEDYVNNLERVFKAEADALDADYKSLKTYADQLEKTKGLSEEMAKKSAIAFAKMSKGIKDLPDQLEELNKQIEAGNQGSVQYYNALNDVNESMKLITNTSEDFSEEFLTNTENLKLMEQAIEGDEEAMLKLQLRAAEETYLNLHIDDSNVDLNEVMSNFTNMYDQIQTWLDNNELTLGPVNSKIIQASMKAWIESLSNDIEEQQRILAKAGFRADVTTERKWAGKIDAPLLDHGYPVFNENGSVETTPVDMYWDMPTLKWESLEYTGTGSTYSPLSSVKSPSKSSKGSGGGGSKRKAKDKRDVADETERYHVLNAQMEDMKNVLDELSDAKDRAFGKSRLAVMDQEIDKTKQQIELQKEYIQQIEDYLRTDKSAIAAYGAEFDAAGNIVNYDALVAQEVAKYNAAVDKYNAGKIDDDSLETYEKAYKEFQDLLKQYEESNDLYQEQARELINLQHELFDKMLEKIQYGVEYKISLSEDSLEYLDYLLGRIDDDAYDAAQAIALLGEKTAEAVAQQEAYQQGLNDILALHLDEQEMTAFNSGDMSVLEGKDFTDNEIQAIREYKSALLEVNEQLEEIRDTIYEKVLDAFNEMSDELDEQIDKFDYYDSLLEHYQNIIDLTGEKVLGISEELASMLDDARIENATNRVAATKSKLDAINSSLLEAEDALERARQEGSEEDVKKWEEIIEEMTATQEDALDNYLQAWEDALEAINDKFDKQMEESIEKFKKALVPDDQVHSLSELYDRQKEIQDQFLPEYQKIYELSKLNRDINQKLADTDNIRAKEMLLELQKEINEYAEDGVEMSQYDLEYLQKKYDLKLAEIALEEAQNAKNQVKLTRDSEGNYGYVYTANQDNIDKAQQDYEDKLYQLQKTNTDYIEKMEQSLVQLYEDYAEALANIRREDFASQEEYEAALAAEAEYWQQRINYVVNEMDKALGHNKDLYETDWQNYSDATGYKIAADERFLDSFEETILAQETGLTTIEELTNAVADATNTLMDELTNLYATWWEQVQEVYAAAEVPVDEYANYIGEKMDEISEKSAETAENTDEMANQMVEDFQEVANAASEWAATYGKALDEIIKKNEDMVKSFNQLIKELKEVEAELSEYANIKADTTKPPTTGSDTKGSGGGDTGGGTPPSTPPKSDPSSYLMAKAKDDEGNPHAYTLDSSTDLLNAIDMAKGSSSIRVQASGLDFTKVKQSQRNQRINDFINKLRNADPYSYAQMEGHGFRIYHRGGLNTYTGPAWLDGTPTNPEMVLNATDTRNMLDIISMVRSIVQMVDTNVSTFTRDINLTTSRINSGGLAQDVTIHAEFPNAVNHSEIEQAFDNLINRASQYANRK